ncbi:hypothetical protein [Paraburkholderia nodosa]|uniref:hypothetical protein n=1 Tax=Paraburkholderia nodosa TaxID=392320 RepID=UPI0006840CDC|nr:hypothetical protein [Paraburkholderia nodosa]
MKLMSRLELAHGIYPVAFDRRWHTGIHLMPETQNDRVRAIADGEVVAYRVCETAIDGGSGAPDSDPGFVLLKHATETGDGRTIIFYSLYMHLLELGGYAACSVNRNILPEFLRTATAAAGQAGGGQKVLRKDVLGLPGRCHGQRHVHFEIFMLPDDFKAYFKPTQLGTTPAAGSDCWGHTYFTIPADQTFVAKPPGTDHHNKLHGVVFPPLQAGTNPGYELQVETYFHGGSKYTSTWAVGSDRVRVPLTSAPVEEKDYEYDMYQRAARLYAACPADGYELLRFGRILADSPTLASSSRATWVRITYASGKQGYIDINASNIKKYSDADFPALAGWEKVTEGNTPFSDDGMCDVGELNTMLTQVGVQPMDAKEYVDEDVLSDYVRSRDEVREQLRLFVCEAPTEWDKTHNEVRYAKLKAPDGFYGKQAQTNPTGYADFLGLLERFQFWDVTGISANKLWYFHPLKFIEVFRRCGWLSQSELAQVYAESNYTHVHKTGAEYKDRYRKSINLTFRKYGLNDQVRMSHFFGQVAVESFYFMIVRECSVAIGQAVSTNHISIRPETDGYLRSPPATEHDVAYFVHRYEGKTGLGNTDTGDGVKFRGRGLKQLTGRYNYSQYWEYRGWSVGGPYNHQWFSHQTNGHYDPGPVIIDPQRVGDDDAVCVDTAGFFWARYRVAKAADGGPTEAASNAVASIVNHYDVSSPPRRWREAQLAYKVLGD